ncbi:aminoglycoside phosphotransferase family protein [Actinacidiphila sp. bgisy167]|uniref:aminoglycoside phosphotransferase family protein n=1 Tax=Actinacidiphila sp. bgisy167 TaxID=3413797 RepID=UPI003D756BA8
MTAPGTSSSVLDQACEAVGISTAGAEPIRVAENEIWRLPGAVVARIARPGQWAAAVREVRVAQWLADNDVPAVRPLPAVEQPVLAQERPVTFWEELPPHEPGTVRDVVYLLKELHSLPIPDFSLGRLEPFVRVAERIDSASTLAADDRAWLRDHLAALQQDWTDLPQGLAECVVHGDAWVGNVARTQRGGVFLLDLERCTVGPPEWDLVSTAVKLTTTGTVTRGEYTEFCSSYGTDVTTWSGYKTMAEARKLRMTAYVAQHAATNPAWHREAQYRVDCLRGRVPGPWRWTGIT